MNRQDFLGLLNQTVKSGNENSGIIKRCAAEFYSEKEFSSVISSAFPFGKVAVLYLKSSFEKFGKYYTDIIRRQSIKPYNYVMPQGVKLSFENIFDVIGIPEDVRAIIFFDDELRHLAGYLCSVLNVAYVCVVKSARTRGIICPQAVFNYENSSDLFGVDCKRYVFIDFDEALKGTDIYKTYLYILSRQISVIDADVKAAVSGRSCDFCIELINSAVNFSRDNFGKGEDFTLKLLYWGIILEIVDDLSYGEILRNSAVFNLEYLTANGFSEEEVFFFAEKILNIYALFLNGEAEELLTVPNYNKRAKELADLTGKDDGEFLNGLLEQRKLFNSSREKINAILKTVKDKIDLTVKTFSEIKEKYRENIIPKDLKKAYGVIKYCGDVPKTFNLMTLVRDSGLTELI